MPVIKNISINQSATHGNGLFATQTVQPGEVLYSKSSVFLGVVSWQNLSTTCSNCFKPPGDVSNNQPIWVKACAQCKLLHFCSKVRPALLRSITRSR
jgi:hypothetical protein